MKTITTFHICLVINILWAAFLLTACAPGPEVPEVIDGILGAERLVAKGTVTNQEGLPLRNITVAIYGVREENEQDLFSYNYTVTDSLGNYMIVRYAGRDTLTTATLVATDSANIYAEQTVFAPVVYEQQIIDSMGSQNKIAYVTADFILQKQ